MGENITLKDLWGQTQTYEGVNEIGIPRGDGGYTWFVERPERAYRLCDTEVTPGDETNGIIASGGIGPLATGSITLMFMAMMVEEDMAQLGITKPCASLITTTASATKLYDVGFVYTYEPIAGSAWDEYQGYSGSIDYTLEKGWTRLEMNDDGVTACEHATGQTITIEEPFTIYDETMFYALLTDATTEEKAVTVTKNGTTEIAPTAGASAIRAVTLTVDVPEASLQSKAVTVTENGTVELTADDGYDGLGSVTVTVEVEGGGSVEGAITAADVTAMLASAGVVEPAATEENAVLSDSNDDIYVF